MKTLVFATHNPNKAKEIGAKLNNMFIVKSLSDIGFTHEIPEDFETLRENAEQKAETIFKATGEDCFADDTGLEVDALNGAPGVFSARYAGKDANSEKNINKLLTELQGVSNRTARFRTVICLIKQGEKHFFEGIAEGEILMAKTGNEGFGYDPVFKPKGFDVSFAEMSLQEKNAISHRALAFEKMLNFLK